MIQKSAWSFLSNVFDNSTRGSLKKMDLLATDHHDKLLANIADPDIDALYNNYLLGNYTNFKTNYANVLATEARYSGRTEATEGFWTALRQNIDDWSFAIEATPGGAFRRGKVNYNTLFPNGYAPFQNGGYEQRLRAVKSLIDVMGDYPALNTVRTTINGFYQQVLAMRTEQQGFENALATARTNAEEARQNLANAMHRVSGMLIFKYAPDTARIDNFYDLSLLRTITRNNNNITTVESTKIDVLPAMQRSILSNLSNTPMSFDFTNIGTTELIIWMSNNENSAIPIDALHLAIGDSSTANHTDLSDGSTDLKYLLVANTDVVTKGKLSYTIL
jgi:hypothetical protein